MDEHTRRNQEECPYEPRKDNVYLQTSLEKSPSIHYMTIHKTHVDYVNKSHNSLNRSCN